jgi:superfamily II DNA or RNA helicase
MELRGYQKSLIEKLRSRLAGGKRRPVVQAPTGAGKTVIAAAIVNMARQRGKKVIFAVPSLSLIDQTVERFTQNGIFDVAVMQGMHELTDASQPVQVCSVQTLARRTIPLVDLVLVDECHQMFKLYDDWMNRPEWKDVPFVGLTATPWAKGMGAKGRWDDLIVCTTTQELIADGTLSDFKVFAPAHPDLTGVQIQAGDYKVDQLGAAMDKKNLVADIVTTWMEKAEDRPTICFAVNRAHAKSIQLEFQEAGVACAYLDGFSDLEERAEVFRQFKAGEVKIISNVGVLTTGFDSDVRCIILARPTRSEILYTQMIGRGLRKAEGKDHCLILDHSDTTLKLGFVTELGRETLDDGTARRQTTERKKPLPKECPKCTFLRPPKLSQCPACGFKPEAKSQIACDDGELYELTKDKKLSVKQQKYTMAEKQIFYSELLLHAHLRGYKSGWAYFAYKDRFGVGPDHSLSGSRSGMIRPETDRWITARNIRNAKRKGAA